MRMTGTAAIVLALAAAAAAQDKVKKDPSALPKKGDAVVLNGCLRGDALEATDVGGDDSSSPLLSGLTFRLTGKKDLLKEMKQKHDGRLVEVRGKLKSELQSQGGYGANIGRVRVTVGTPSAGAGGPENEAQRALPLVEVSAFDGMGTACAR
jgi:hypothetical protein